MHWNNIFIAGTASYLPEAVETAEQAVAEGRYSEGERVSNGFRAVRVATAAETGPVMAAAAARSALGRAGTVGEDVGLTVHACVGHQGQEFWTPANYVHQEGVGGHGLTMELRQGSNGGLSGLELAASHLASRPEGPSSAVVTTGDSFRLPYFDRWATDSQQVYGDGAGALVVSNRSGFARVLSTVSLSDSTLEPIYRGTNGWTDAPFPDGKPVDLATRKSSYLQQHEDGYEEVITKMTGHATAVLQQAVTEAGTTVADLDHFVHANIAETIVAFSFHSLLGIPREKTPYDWGLDYAHMGAGDQIIGLDHLASTGQLKPGDLVGTMGVGVGFVWTAAIFEILESPSW